jgi:ABC-type nitrate/sulfonate/bicarbonate transport system substrate-binding protein
MKKKLLIMGILIFLMSALSGCGSKEADKVTINIGNQPGGADFVVAQENGYFNEAFADLNVEVNIVDFANGAEVTAAMASGDIDFGAMADQPSLAAIAAGYGVVNIGLYGTTGTYAGLYATEESGINKVEDLVGKKIGVMQGTTLEYLLHKLLDRAGIDENDVEIVNTKDTVSLLSAGEIDAALSNLAVCADLLENGTVYEVENIGDEELMMTNWIIARKDFVENNKEVTAAFLKALNMAQQYEVENPEEAAQLVAGISQISENNIYNTLINFDYYGYDITDDALESAKMVLEYLQANGTIENQDIKIEDTVDYQYIELAGLREK